ncbi:hypothetical protein J0S82_002456, partial [Galemys pyrenaicus]
MEAFTKMTGSCAVRSNGEIRSSVVAGAPKMRLLALRKSYSRAAGSPGGLPYMFSGAGSLGAGHSSGGLGRSSADAARGGGGEASRLEWPQPGHASEHLRDPKKEALKSFMLIRRFTAPGSGRGSQEADPTDNQVVSTTGERYSAKMWGSLRPRRRRPHPSLPIHHQPEASQKAASTEALTGLQPAFKAQIPE